MDYNAKMAELAQYKRMLEDVQATVEGLQDEIKRYMIENGIETLTGTEHKASYKPVMSTRIDTSALKRDMPDIASKYSKTSVSNRFIFA